MGVGSTRPRVVQKKDVDLHMTVDHSAVNAIVDALPWPMPDLEADLANAAGSS